MKHYPEIERIVEVALGTAIERIEQQGYARGLMEGASRFAIIASVIPSSVTKAQFVKMARQHAEALDRAAYACGAMEVG